MASPPRGTGRRWTRSATTPTRSPRPRDVSFAGASYIDLYNLDRLIQAIDRTYLRGRPLWLTEFGFSTRRVSQYPTWFSSAKQAAFLVDAYRRVRALPRVAIFTWYFLQDNPALGLGAAHRGGPSQPAFQAFSLPLAAVPPPGAAAGAPVRRGAALQLVGQIRSSPRATRVVLQRRDAGRWRTLARVPTSDDGSFAVTVRPATRERYRARWTGVARTGARVTRISPSVLVRVG